VGAYFSALHAHGSGTEEVKISASVVVASFPVDAQPQVRCSRKPAKQRT
jgi:hypothetical protein